MHSEFSREIIKFGHVEMDDKKLRYPKRSKVNIRVDSESMHVKSNCSRGIHDDTDCCGITVTARGSPVFKKWQFHLQGPIIKETFDFQPCTKCRNCKGFLEHEWRKSCKECKCQREFHIVKTECGARARIGLITPVEEEKHTEYTWVPAGLDDKQISKYFSTQKDDDIPKVGSPGEQKRKQRLVTQLPKQDLTPDGCKHLKPEDLESFKDFVRSRNQIALKIGIVQIVDIKTNCSGCSKTIPAKYLAVTTGARNSFWHPECFRCTTCTDLLVDLAYCECNSKLYCIRHYSEQIRPRCHACDEVSHYTSQYI